jgi:two-component system chemotaxis response regulator CheB
MSAPKQAPRLRALVVDDSAANRQVIREVLSSSGEVDVVAEAGDGEEALRELVRTRPDVVTLDLEMPRMDGFTFLRIAMSRQPTPVVVLSTHSDKANVFKALELGALDFVEKPARGLRASAAARRDLIAKVLLARSLGRLQASTASGPMLAVQPGNATRSRAGQRVRLPPRFLVAIGASTGGPAAIGDLVAALPERSSLCLLVAQHMPERFTKAFADRLDARGRFRVSEAHDGALGYAGMGFVCPGGRCMEVEDTPSSTAVRVRVLPPTPHERYVPSVDRLFRSVGETARSHAVAVVLTGMGDDGLRGAEAIRAQGGMVIAESEQSAIVHGMPGAVIRAGLASKVLPLAEIAAFLSSLS